MMRQVSMLALIVTFFCITLRFSQVPCRHIISLTLKNFNNHIKTLLCDTFENKILTTYIYNYVDGSSSLKHHTIHYIHALQIIQNVQPINLSHSLLKTLSLLLQVQNTSSEKEV